MMALAITIIFICVQYAVAQNLGDVNSATIDTQNRREPNPDSAILTKFGNMFLDFDEAFSRYTSPKVDAEDIAKEQLYDKTQSSRSNYFDRIRENYRTLQKRVGSALGITGDLSILSDLLGINVQNKDDEQLVDVSLPFFPMKLSVSSKQVKDINAVDSSTAISEVPITITHVPEQPKADIESNLQLGNVKIDVRTKSAEEIPHVNVDIRQHVQARTSRQSLRNENKVRKISSEPENVPEHSEELFSKEDEFATSEFPGTEENSGISGRILGDVLYSESIFDKIMKRVIKDSMWLLDSDLSPSKAFERLNRFTQKATQRNEKFSDLSGNTGLAGKKEKESFTAPYESKEHGSRSSSETLRKQNISPKPLHYEADDKPNQDRIKFDFITQPGSEFKLKSQDEDNILLAFTLEGVPLKLKMPDVQNPLRFLHETLTAADVALNVPIESYEDIEPIGREILQLGSGNGRMMSRALFIDLSDSQQLKSLLKILRKFKSTSYQI